MGHTNTNSLWCSIAMDGILIIHNQKKHLIQKDDIQDTFFDIRKKICDTSINNIYIIHGPGSFTTLRIASLIINTHILLEKLDITIHCMDKIQLFTHIQKTITPQKTHSYIYIGQKKHCRSLDHTTTDITKILYDDTINTTHTIICDYMMNTPHQYRKDNMISFDNREDTTLTYTYRQEKYTYISKATDRTTTKILVPSYLITGRDEI